VKFSTFNRDILWCGLINDLLVQQFTIYLHTGQLVDLRDVIWVHHLSYEAYVTKEMKLCLKNGRLM